MRKRARGRVLTFNVSYNLLRKAGYKMLPNHSYSEVQYDEHWYTGIPQFGRCRFPRFHIIKDREDYYIHYDFLREHNFREGILFEGKEIDKEFSRISNLRNKL